MAHLHDMYLQNCMLTAECGGLWFRHVLREGNCEADSLCNKVMDEKRSWTKCWPHAGQNEKGAKLRCSFDGGKRGKEAASAWVIEVVQKNGKSKRWAEGGMYLEKGSVAFAETYASKLMLEFLKEVCHGHGP